MGPPLVAVTLPDSVDNVLLSGSVLLAAVENSDVSLLRSVLSGPPDDREVETSVGPLCDEDCAPVVTEVPTEASLLVLTSVVEGPGVGPDGEVTSVEMLPCEVSIVDTGLLVSVERPCELSELNDSEPVDTPVSLDRLEKPDPVDKGEVVAWLDTIDESNAVDDAPV